MKDRQKCTGVIDEKCNPIYLGDKVKFMNMVGEVAFGSGAYGIVFDKEIDWDKMENEIPKVTGCNNRLYACKNDYFISFFEIIWNFNCEEEYCEVVEIVKPVEVENRNL